MGDWRTTPKPPHIHDNPKSVFSGFNEGYVIGAVWQCKCGDLFEVTDAVIHHDQRDGDYYELSWQQIWD